MSDDSEDTTLLARIREAQAKVEKARVEQERARAALATAGREAAAAQKTLDDLLAALTRPLPLFDRKGRKA